MEEVLRAKEDEEEVLRTEGALRASVEEVLRAKEEVKRPEMTACTSIHSGNPALTAAL